MCLVPWVEMDPYVTHDPAHQGLVRGTRLRENRMVKDDGQKVIKCQTGNAWYRPEVEFWKRVVIKG